ncbi:MAG: iron-containing alcohol dehydrogenase, partial [Actinomycetota bacterium]|nr:iron-containing alcohol dehydrogenase [Actinomycetota bacterium]
GLTSGVVTGRIEAGFEPLVFAEVAGEPDVPLLLRAVSLVRGMGTPQVVGVVGVGGGSALDTAKITAYCSATGVAPEELGGPLRATPAFPTLILVPTTVGTGAEATRVAMFSLNGAKRAVLSPQFVPDVAILDGDLVADLPAAVVAATALDALSHALESMMSTTCNHLTWRFSVDAARIIFDQLRPACAGDREARAELQYASFLAGVSLNAGVVLGHSMSYVLAGRHHLAHGVGCALALPYCLAYNQNLPAHIGLQMAEAVLRRSGSTMRELAEAVQQITADVGLPTDLGALDVQPGDAEALAVAVARDYPRPTNPIELIEPRLEELFRHLSRGDLSGAWTAMEGQL